MREIRLQDVPQFAQEVLAEVPASSGRERAFLIALQGELGAGKTTFMQAFARALGIEETVQSPTYVLMKKYSIAHQGYETLVHIDAYRLDEPLQFKALRPEEFWSDPKSIVCIEWPERVEEILPKPDLLLRFSHAREGATRTVAIEPK